MTWRLGGMNRSLVWNCINHIITRHMCIQCHPTDGRWSSNPQASNDTQVLITSIRLPSPTGAIIGTNERGELVASYRSSDWNKKISIEYCMRQLVPLWNSLIPLLPIPCQISEPFTTHPAEIQPYPRDATKNPPGPFTETTNFHLDFSFRRQISDF